MLAYVFWHWPQPGVDTNTYVAHLVDFHLKLNAHKPAGFQGSRVLRLSGASWLDTKGDAFEDWYLIDDSAALDRINDAAVSGPCEAPHTVVAREAAGGTAGLYRLRLGKVDVDIHIALWLSKPDRMSYKDFYSALEPVVADGALWQRQMTLGPTTEFVIHSANAIQLPDAITANQLLAVQSMGSDPMQP
ncbi:MAG TPA: hypothetical protein VFS77_07145 [Pyrinomonadaceae bacterium]|nr:hypothetical protein [Pyrinomonadaceae bacterium]